MRDTIRDTFEKPFTVVGIATTGILSALALTITRLLSFFPVGPSVRVDPGGPAIIMLSGMLLGPIGGALVGGLSDVLGFLFWNPTGYAWNPLIFVGQMMYGLVAGLIFLKKPSFDKVAIGIQIGVATIIAYSSGFLFITWGLAGILEMDFWVLFIGRIGPHSVMLVWYMIICIALYFALEKVYRNNQEGTLEK